VGRVRNKAGAHTLVFVNIVIFDLSALRYRFNKVRSRVSAMAPTGEVLSVVELSPGTPTSEAAFLSVNAALDSARLLRNGKRCGLGAYNPYSGEVSVNGVPATLIFSAGRAIELSDDGDVFVMDDDSLQSVESGLVLDRKEPSVARVSRSLAAHS